MSNFMWFLLGGALVSAVFLFILLYHCKRQRVRLLALTSYLEAASCGKETVLTRIEDEFSLLEDELYKTVNELRIAREQAQHERQQQIDNLADIAHQLKTPLTSMSLMTQLLANEANADQQEYIKRIDNQLIRLNWLTSSLLTMSRLDAGAIKFAPAILTVEELSSQALEIVEQVLYKRSQSIIIHNKEAFLYCDPYWTAEVLVNLIKNCSEHTPLGGQIIIEAETTPLYTQITVSDNGSGFEADELPQLFRRFFRGKNSDKDSIGIGLALCRSIIEGQGGIIRAEKHIKGGACFIIRFYSQIK